jgi:hypothetical protein
MLSQVDSYLSDYYKKHYGINCTQKDEKEKVLVKSTIEWFKLNTAVSDDCKHKLNTI